MDAVDVRGIRDDLSARQAHTTGPAALHLPPGGHFHLRAHEDRFLARLRDRLTRLGRGPTLPTPLPA
ncbi:hypothetical protein AB0469_18060 [Streptomyces sp. NPDC093801]|uniref:hypothetical protein n=1 Tax=Streptomyces sp. NPDC093801 TaxID=3155203 RepID=UPI00344FF122